MPHSSIPAGYCRCGCGQRTRIAPQTRREAGWIQGKPQPYVTGHSRRNRGVKRPLEPIPELATVRLGAVGWLSRRGRAEERERVERRATRAKNRREREHRADPAVKLYRAERKARLATMTDPLADAKVAYARLLAQDEQRAKGGRPKRASAFACGFAGSRGRKTGT
jgi:hypothetical protein